VLDGLIDHAALFPPASMSLEDALAEDGLARGSPHASVIGRFVVPTDLLPVLPDERPPLSVVLRDSEDIDSVRDASGVEAVELRLGSPRPQPSDLVETYRALQPLGVETYFELVIDDGWRDSVPAAVGSITAIGGRVKLRCGGEAVPTIDQVAFVIQTCRESGVPFKATAGLHHAVRHDGEHGFLNLLAAASAPADTLRAVLGEEDASALELEPAARQVFTSFGSCDWRTPVAELEALGLLS
jgi:hypothetical protein